jgi:hypothetical protein
MVVNGLAMKFKAPEYAKTSQYEVRRLRMSALPLMPNFIAKERSAKAEGHSVEESQAKQIGSSINPKMSPMEAAFIMVLLLKQKVSNPDYQVTQAERASKWVEQHSSREKNKKPLAKNEASMLRQEEMERIINKGVSQISPIDCPKHASAKLCTFGARLSVATYFSRMIEVLPDAR